MGSQQNANIALLSLDPAREEVRSNRRIVGGASALERQVDVALALGCNRIWLFAPVQDQLALAAQKLAEQGEAQFRLIQKGRQLLGSLREQDRLLVLTEGLLIPDAEALSLLDAPSVILRVSAEEGKRAGFERIDQAYCWAGAMQLPGRVIERLDELAEDMDPISALLRAGRSSRVAEQDIAQQWVTDGRWSLESDRVPTLQLAVESAKHGPNSMGSTLAAPFAKLLVDMPRLRMAIGGIALVMLLVAAILLGQRLALPALVAIAAADVLARVWFFAQRRCDPRIFSRQKNDTRPEAGIQAASIGIGLAALTIGLMPDYGEQAAFYLALVTGFMWFLASRTQSVAARIFSQFSILWVLSAVAGLAGQWFWAAAAASLLSAAAILINMRNQPGITLA